MARQGIRRTHTGCVTCKIRRVKCDETRPACVKCSSTGRRCDGYQIWLPKTLRQIQPSTIPGVSSKDLESLDYFRQVVGPAMAGPLPRLFWTWIVPQLTHTEVAVRHATIAISTLYGTAEENALGAILAPQEKFALAHYNSAIGHIVKSHNLNNDMLGVACILFNIVELCRDNIQGAWFHYQHGIALLSSHEGSSNIRGLFRQLHLLTSFFFEHFGLPPLNETAFPKPVGPFKSLVNVQECLDSLAYRSHKAAHVLGENYASHPDVEISGEALLQDPLHLDLETWYSTFQIFKAPDPHNNSAYMALEARYLICKIWTDATYYRNCAHTPDHVKSNIATAAEFISASNIPPVLQAMLRSGQNLQVRLAALALLDARLKHAAHSERTAEECEALFIRSKGEIHREHGIKLGTRWTEADELESLTGMSKNLPQNLFVRTHFLCPWVLMVLNVVDRVGQYGNC